MGTGLAFTFEGIHDATPDTTVECRCPLANSIILPSFTCFLCPNKWPALTPHECGCPSGFVWSSAQKECLQCGSEQLPRSLRAVSPFVCSCSSGYVWDVMTQGCILASGCSVPSASCMNCGALGAAVTLDPSVTRNATQGNFIRNQLRSHFSNYDQVSGFMCNCP